MTERQRTDTGRYGSHKRCKSYMLAPRTVKVLRNLVFERNLNLHAHCDLVPMAAEYIFVDLDQAIGSDVPAH